MSKYINETLSKEQRLGQVGVNNQGEKITIIRYGGSIDIDVQFEDGIIAYNRSYDYFIKGKIPHPIRYEESFAYYLEVELGLNLDDIWNWDKNNELGINPYEITRCSGKKVWLYCLEKDYHNDFGGYEISCCNFNIGRRCGYCASRKVHPKDSFAQWGIDTFREDFLEKYWSSNNTLDPWEISKCNNKKIWLYCQEHDYHNYDREGNKIGYQINCDSFYNGSRCGYCGKNKTHWKDSIVYNYPNIAKMIAIPENDLTFDDCYNIAYKSCKKFYFKCNDCGILSDKPLTLRDIINQGYSCKKCGDGISIPNKFMYNLLTQLNENFESEYSPYYFRNTQRTDFLLTDYNIIIEMDGNYGNHTREYDLWRDFLNMKYGGYKTIRIDLTNSKEYYTNTFNHIKQQIINSELSNLFNLSNIDWELTWEKTQKSKCVKAWELWNSGIHSTIEISKILGLTYQTINTYLKRGAKLGKCDYTKEESVKNRNLKNSGKNNYQATKIICITTKRIFHTMRDGAKKYKMKSAIGISRCCRIKQDYCGKLEDGTPLVWRYININHNKILRGKDILKLHSKINQEVA